jgi:hypothetical protein
LDHFDGVPNNTEGFIVATQSVSFREKHGHILISGMLIDPEATKLTADARSYKLVASLHPLGKAHSISEMVASDQITQFKITPTGNLPSPNVYVPNAKQETCADLGWKINGGKVRPKNKEVCSSSQLGAGNCYNSKDHDWMQAYTVCSMSGGRLCALEEVVINLAALTGCGLDSKYVWTSTPCAGGFFVAPGNANSVLEPECRAFDQHSDGIRCCSDTDPTKAWRPPDELAAATAIDTCNVCPTELDPVCVHADNLQYRNWCFATCHREGKLDFTNGPCPPNPETVASTCSFCALELYDPVCTLEGVEFYNDCFAACNPKTATIALVEATAEGNARVAGPDTVINADEEAAAEGNARVAEPEMGVNADEEAATEGNARVAGPDTVINADEEAATEGNARVAEPEMEVNADEEAATEGNARTVSSSEEEPILARVATTRGGCAESNGCDLCAGEAYQPICIAGRSYFNSCEADCALTEAGLTITFGSALDGMCPSSVQFPMEVAVNPNTISIEANVDTNTVPEQSSDGCYDLPLFDNQPWADLDGDECASYTARNWCTATGNEGKGWGLGGDKIADFAAHGISAFKACCSCGGGFRGGEENEAAAATTKAPSDQATAEELAAAAAAVLLACQQCSAESSFVCVLNKQTYFNPCYAICTGQNRFTEGACEAVKIASAAEAGETPIIPNAVGCPAAALDHLTEVGMKTLKRGLKSRLGKKWTKVTLEQCAEACIDQPECLSVQYDPIKRVCHVLAASGSTSTLNRPYKKSSSIVHWHRTLFCNPPN